MIKLGTTAINKIIAGFTPIGKAYRGTEVIFGGSASLPPVAPSVYTPPNTTRGLPVEPTTPSVP